MRDVFEQRCFAYYQRLKLVGWTHADEGDLTHESLFWRREGHPTMYGVHQIEAAWQGFQMAHEVAAMPTTGECDSCFTPDTCALLGTCKYPVERAHGIG